MLSYYQVFDPIKAKAAGKLDFVHTTGNIPCPLKEAAMVALHQRDYNTNGGGFNNDMKAAKPLDGSDWTDAERDTFRDAIFEHRKDLPAVAKELGKSVCNVYTYYLSTYKPSDDYRLLKVVCQQETKEKEPDALADDDICQICKEGGHLLICDGCDLSYHTTCLRPPLKEVPDGEWHCDYCLDEKLLAARDVILKQSKLLQPTSSTNASGTSIDQRQESVCTSSDGMKTDDGSSSAEVVVGNSMNSNVGKDRSSQVYSDEIMAATRTFAEAFRKALSTATSGASDDGIGATVMEPPLHAARSETT